MLKTASTAWLERIYPTQASREFIARAYRSAFGGEHGQAVLRDLQKACYQADTTTLRQGGPVDPYQMAINEGRRQAYLHIAGILAVTGIELTTKGPSDYDHRDERRDPDERAGYQPRYPGGHDPTLDGPISGSEPDPAVGE